MGSQEQHALALLENLRRLYETEDCFLSDVTLLARDGQIKGRGLATKYDSSLFLSSYVLNSLLHYLKTCIFKFIKSARNHSLRKNLRIMEILPFG
jgi:hypothetical protein